MILVLLFPEKLNPLEIMLKHMDTPPPGYSHVMSTPLLAVEYPG